MLKRLPGLLWTVGLIVVAVRKFAPDLPARVAERVTTTAAELPGAISVEEPTRASISVPTVPAEDGPVTASPSLPLQAP